ncbi:MAG TPA: serine hydrolase domain-containing protein [Spirochaetota bacterium]
MEKKLSAVALIVALSVSAAVFLDCGNGEPKNHHSLPEFYSDTGDVPTSGKEYPGVEAYDREMKKVMVKWNIPGAVIALAKNGKLILVRGYGYSDYEGRVVMNPDSVSRIGSISKTLTALAILRLRDEGKLNLDARFLDILTDFHVPDGGDSRINTITIRQLLNHCGGWDRTESPDPINDGLIIERMYGLSGPPARDDYVRYALTKHLDFSPGERWAYCNVGYLILGSVIEKVSGEPYEIYVREHVLAPMDVYSMSIGYEHLEDRRPGEVKYYDPWYDDSLFPGEGVTPRPYGWTNMKGIDAAGGWVCSAIELTRIMTAMDGSRKPPFLSSDSMREMLKNPGLPEWSGDRSWYGMGLFVGPPDDRWGHGGSMAGMQSNMYRLGNGYVWVVITNSRSEDPDKYSSALFWAMTNALGSGISGSDTDLYDQYPSVPIPPRGD